MKPNVGEPRFRLVKAGLFITLWLRTLVNVAMNFVFTRSVILNSFPTDMSRFQLGSPRRIPAPPVWVSRPTRGGRNWACTAAGLANRLRLVPVPWTELPPVYGANRMAFSLVVPELQ